MKIAGVFKSGLRVTSKETALEFLKGVKNVILLPYDNEQVIRVESDYCISLIPKKSVNDGSAPFIPSFKDEDGSIAYGYRKYINAYLSDL